MEIKFAQVPPPEEAPLQSEADALGLCLGLRAEKSNWQYRCASCGAMQPDQSWQVWVPDGVRRDDQAWSVTEAARRSAYNGHFSGWCLACAPKADDSHRAKRGRVARAADDPSDRLIEDADLLLIAFYVAIACAVTAGGLAVILIR